MRVVGGRLRDGGTDGASGEFKIVDRAQPDGRAQARNSERHQ